MTKSRKRLVAAVVVPVQIGLSVLAWRDMAARTDAQIRGNRKVWQGLTLLNPGNCVAYWVLGRR